MLRANKLPWDMRFDGRGNYNISDDSINASAMLSKQINETVGVMVFDRYDENLGNQIGAGLRLHLSGL